MVENLVSDTRTCFFNLAKVALTPFQTLAISLSLKHIPNHTFPVYTLKDNLRQSATNFQRRLKIALYFALSEDDQNSAIPRKLNNTWEPTNVNAPWFKYVDTWYCNIINKIDNIAFTHKHKLNYVDKQIIVALKQIKQMTNIVIKPADKNLGPVVMTRQQYETMCYEHLNDKNTYQIITNYDPNKCYTELENILERNNKRYIQYNNNKPTKRETPLCRSLCQLKNNKNQRAAYFYCNPKMHKTVVKGRPIVSTINSVTYHTSIYLHKILFTILSKLITLVPSSRDALLIINKRQFAPNSKILCADVTSLYPSIPIQYGLNKMREMIKIMKKRFQMDINDELTMQLLEWVLNNNYFEFNNVVYKQLTGTAMGTPVAPVYANIVLFFHDQQCIRLEPQLYMRYLDDLFIVTNNDEQAHSIISVFNAQCDRIKLEAVTINTSGIFLDMELTINDTIIVTKIYQKAINKYIYLTPKTMHPKSVLRSFLLQECKRYRLICTFDHDYEQIIKLFIKRLHNRSYNALFLRKEILPLVPSRQEMLQTLYKSTSKKAKPSNLIVTISQSVKMALKLSLYSPSQLFCLNDAIRYCREFNHKYGTTEILFAITNGKSISQYIIRAKYNPIPYLQTSRNDVNEVDAILSQNKNAENGSGTKRHYRNIGTTKANKRQRLEPTTVSKKRKSTFN